MTIKLFGFKVLEVTTDDSNQSGPINSNKTNFTSIKSLAAKANDVYFSINGNNSKSAVESFLNQSTFKNLDLVLNKTAKTAIINARTEHLYEIKAGNKVLFSMYLHG